MAPSKRSSLPGSTASSSWPSKKQKSTFSMPTENTSGYSTQDWENMVQKQICKIEEVHAVAVQKMEQFQAEFNKLKEMLNIPQYPPDTNQTRSELDHGRYELKIIGTIKNRVFTDSLVKGQNGEFLKVEILHNGEKITSGTFASAKFEVLVVEGDFCVSEHGWSAKTFQESLVEEREEVGSILKGRYISELKNGEACLDGLTFKDNSSWNKKKWRLGIRLLQSNGVRVLEAISNCIRVLDRHGKACEKLHPPLLTDEVKYLEKVGKKRASDLKKKGIHTIKDFLRLLNRKPSCLLKILHIKSKSDASLEKMIEHAKESYVGPKLCSYRKNNCLLFFNSVYEVVGAQFGCRYRSFDKLQHSKKMLVNKWKKGFYKSIKNRKFTADFQMVNGQPLPIEHDFTGTPTDNEAPQNGYKEDNRALSQPNDVEEIVLGDPDDADTTYEVGPSGEANVFPVSNPHPSASRRYAEDPAYGTNGETTNLGHNPDESDMNTLSMNGTHMSNFSFGCFSNNDNDASDTRSLARSNGYGLLTNVNASGDVIGDPHVFVNGHNTNSDLHDSLVANPLAFGGDDHTLPLIPTIPPSGTTLQGDASEHGDMTNRLHPNDRISLSLAGVNHEDTTAPDPAYGRNGETTNLGHNPDESDMSTLPLNVTDISSSSFEWFINNCLSLAPSNGYGLLTDVNASGDVIGDPHVFVNGHNTNSDLHDSLVANPLAFGGDDHTLPLIPTIPPSGTTLQGDASEHGDMTNRLHPNDRISLSLAGVNHEDTTAPDPAYSRNGETTNLGHNPDESDKSTLPLNGTDISSSSFEWFINNCLSLAPSNGYGLLPDVNSSGDVIGDPHVFVNGHNTNFDLHDSLVANPLAFGGDDHTLPLILTIPPSGTTLQGDASEHGDMTNRLHPNDRISLSLAGVNHEYTIAPDQGSQTQNQNQTQPADLGLGTGQPWIGNSDLV